MAMIGQWNNWKPFPDPRKGELLCATIGPGCYELRHRSTGQKICFGKSVNIASRMCSLLSRENGGNKSRDNTDKQDHVAKNLANTEYRTIAFLTVKEAESYETAELKARKGDYLFPT
jgi:hypothetical protein